MFGPCSSSFQNSKDAALVQPQATFQPLGGKGDLQAPSFGQGNRSSQSLDVLSAKAGSGSSLPKGLAQQLNVLLPAPSNIDMSSLAGYGGTTSAGYGGTTTTPLPEGKCHYNQGIGNGAEGGDPGKSRPHGGSNDEGGRTPGKR